jgi:putative flippase GtrA
MKQLADKLLTTLYAWLVKVPFLAKRISRETLGQFLRYLVVGFTSFGVEYTLFIVFRHLLPLPELVVNIGVYTVIFWLNFTLNRLFAFRSKAPLLPQLLAYGFLFAFNLVVGNILLFSAIRHGLVLLAGEGSWPVLYLPKILIMVFIVSWNFILYKKIIYK